MVGACDREAEAPQVVVLVVVAIPTAVALFEIEREPNAAGRFDWLLELENCFARHVAAAGADIDAEFVKGLDERELLYLMDKILMAYRLCQSEYVKKCEASRG